MGDNLLASLVSFRETLGSRKPAIPEVLRFFVPYAKAYPSWGSLHAIADGNYDCAEYCIKWAAERGDKYGEELAMVLSNMSKTQRSKIMIVAWNFANVARQHPPVPLSVPLSPTRL